MALRNRRRAFVNGVCNLRRSTSIANSYRGLRHQLLVGSEVFLFPVIMTLPTYYTTAVNQFGLGWALYMPG